MKDLKYEHQSTFPLWGRVKLNFRDRYRKLNVFSKNSSRYQLLSSNSQKLSLWCKKKIITHMDLYDPYMVPYTILQGYYNFPTSTNKIPFFDKISTSGRICRLNERLKIWTPKHKYEHQILGWGGGGVGVGGGVGYYNFPRSTNEIKSFDEILTSEKIIFFCIFLLWGRVKLNFRDRYGKPNIYSKNSSCYQVFSSNSQKLSLWCKNKLIMHADGFVWPI